MPKHVARDPTGEGFIFKLMFFKLSVDIGKIVVNRVDEKSADAINFRLGQRRWAILKICPLGFDFGRKTVEPQLLDQNLDARLVQIVAATEAVIDAEYCLKVGKEVFTRQVFANDVAENRRAPQSTADENAEAHFTCIVAHRMHTDVVKQRTDAVLPGTVHRDLELARQIGKFRMERRPLPDQFRVWTRIDQFVVCDTGKLVRCGVANAVTRGLDGVHFNAGQISQYVGHALQCRPVKLDVLASGEVGVAAIISSRNRGQHAQLSRR